MALRKSCGETHTAGIAVLSGAGSVVRTDSDHAAESFIIALFNDFLCMCGMTWVTQSHTAARLSDLCVVLNRPEEETSWDHLLGHKWTMIHSWLWGCHWIVQFAAEIIFFYTLCCNFCDLFDYWWRWCFYCYLFYIYIIFYSLIPHQWFMLVHCSSCTQIFLFEYVLPISFLFPFFSKQHNLFSLLECLFSFTIVKRMCGKVQRAWASCGPQTPVVSEDFPWAMWPGHMINWSIVTGPSTATQSKAFPIRLTYAAYEFVPVVPWSSVARAAETETGKMWLVFLRPNNPPLIDAGHLQFGHCWKWTSLPMMPNPMALMNRWQPCD